MKKQLLTIVLVLLCAGVFAQGKGIKLSIGPEVGLPIGDAHDGYSVVFGGTAKLEFPVSNSGFNITYTTGYVNYFGKNQTYSFTAGGRTTTYNFKASDEGFIPMKLGGKYYANKFLYVEGEAGIAIFVKSVSSTNNISFAYAPGIGVSLPFAKKRNALDLGFRFEGWSKNGGETNQLALRLAYKFGL